MKRNSAQATLVLLATLPLAAGAADASPAPAAKDEAPPLFKELDSNRDGAVSKDEAKRSAEVTARFGEADADRDGKLTVAEFRKGMAPKQ